MKKSKLKNNPFKNKKEECDFYWSLLVKAIAGFVSEISGAEGDLQSHHLAGKSCYALRYSLLNGMSCTDGEHHFGFHHTGRAEAYRQKVKELRGSDIFERLERLKNEESIPLLSTKKQLLSQLKNHEQQIINWYSTKDYKTPSVKKKYEYLFEQLKGIYN